MLLQLLEAKAIKDSAMAHSEVLLKTGVENPLYGVPHCMEASSLGEDDVRLTRCSLSKTDS